MKLKTKLPLLFISLVCIPLILLGAMAFVELKSAAEKSSATQVTKFLEQVVAQTDRLIKTAQANVELIADDSLLHSYMLTEDEDERYTLMQRPLLRKLKSIMKVFPQYYEMRVILPDGYEDLRLTSYFIANLKDEEEASELFISMGHDERNEKVQFITNPDNDKFSLYVSKRVEIINKAVESFNAAPKMRGYFVITVSLDALNDVLLDSPWSGARFIITDQSGSAVLPYSAKSESDIASVYKALKEEQESPSSFSVHELDGESYYHTSLSLKSGLWLHALLPEDILLQYSRDMSWLVAMITLFSVAFSIPLLLFLSHFQIVRPLNKLHHAFLRLGKNVELIQVKTSGDDELDELGKEFNRMSLKLFKSNEKIRELAFNDPLTGLPNRFMFTKHLNLSLESAKCDSGQLAVMFIDLDNFKHINDNLGHQSGDQLLHEIGDRLQRNLRSKDFCEHFSDSDMVARLGGDEFTVFLGELPSIKTAEKVAKRILDIISLPIVLGGKNYYISASIGIACYPQNGVTTQELIKNADIAMYHAKKTGKGSYQHFSDSLSRQNEEFSVIEQKMHEAVENERFELYFQPIVDSSTHRIVSLEALIRWYDDEFGFIPPDKFIPLAEKNGLIMVIGDWVIREACRQLKIWQDRGILDIQLAINVSAIQLNNPKFAQQLYQCITESGIIPGTLYIELTETTIINGEQEIFVTLEWLRSKGIRIALDDFGTGYSSLSYLRNLPIDILKIDQSFIRDINNKNNNVILSAVIVMAHALGFKVVAEGVEERGHLAFLVKEGCDLLQGYMFSRPQAADDITRILLKETKEEASKTG
ncbi:EAL domain-containing protein [Shewanella atlantica]|uniref:EAL domain-containing protein n=1 Tax=Shewanella atlantica TaxID=271099 RepID=A0A431WDB4_9GAMM|nr:EAL domain-containing protein [Shewanella atlantica]RTR33345.1 EAL domain-containing protein [Shewanella atlantica]